MNKDEDKEIFKKISDAANDAIILADNEDRITYWNMAAEKMLGYPRGEAIGKKLHQTIIPDRFRDAHVKGFMRFCETGQGSVIGKTVELAAIRKDGTEFPIELSLSSVKVSDKWNAIGIIRDITERKRMEEELRVSHNMSSIGRLAGSVFHEILNPVNIISAHTQLLLMGAEKGSQVESDLMSIREEVERIVTITEELLKFSRKEEHGVNEVDVNSLLEVTLSIAEPETKLKNIEIFKVFEENVPVVMAYDNDLKQVFAHLITNAIDAMPEGGTLTIKTRNVPGKEFDTRSRNEENSERKGDCIEISFEDTGCGIAEKDIDKIFEPFFTTRRDRVVGVGLGLSTSYAIIEGYGGRLSVESEAGNGATFTISLPVGTSAK